MRPIAPHLTGPAPDLWVSSRSRSRSWVGDVHQPPHVSFEDDRGGNGVGVTGGLSGHTLFASTEPCPMCAAAAYWSGIGRIVYGLSARRLKVTMSVGRRSGITLSCRALLARGAHRIVVLGPMLEDEAVDVHRDFWSR